MTNEPWVTTELVSKSPKTDDILITFVIDMPKFLVAEFNTHRMISRNSASTRAIPLKTQLARLNDALFIPPNLYENCKGMAGKELMPPKDYDTCIRQIKGTYMYYIRPLVERLAELNVHKQHAGRYLEPWMWTRVIATANIEWWEDFVRQRNSTGAQPEIQRIASEVNVKLSEVRLNESKYYSQWHLPLLTLDERETVSRLPGWFHVKEVDWSTEGPSGLPFWCAVSAARCARISYLNERGERDYSEDLDLFSRLLKDSHHSPFEHVARVIDPKRDRGIYFREGMGLMDGNFMGWRQYRSLLTQASK